MIAMAELEAIKEFDKFKEHLSIGDQVRGSGLSIAYYKQLQELILIERELLQLALKGLRATKEKEGV